MVTSQQLIDLIEPVMTKAKAMDDGSKPRLDYRAAAIELGHSEGIATFLGTALYWENDIQDWIAHIRDGLIEP